MKKNVVGKLCAVLIGSSAVVMSQAQPSYNLSQIQKEPLNRGLVAIRSDKAHVALSWRYLSSDPINTIFRIYRNGKQIGSVDGKQGTFFIDKNNGGKKSVYQVRPVVDGVETHAKDGLYTLPAHAPVGYINIPLEVPLAQKTPSGQDYFYAPNDASIGDVDGDGEYEIILKWDPSNAHDNSHNGYTGNVFFDCYKLNGKRLWRIDLGHNVRAGAHYTQFMVYDLNGDGKAEVVMKTADGTVDGMGTVIGDPKADYRETGTFDPDKKYSRTYYRAHAEGRIIQGPEYLTVFEGNTGKALYTTDYVPPRGDPQSWGDERANRSDRFLACVAYLDGVHPSVVMCRGYYTRMVLAAFDWDGKALKQRWVFDTNEPEWQAYAGQGNHNLRVADVDGDGCDEIVYGSATIDHDGKGLYSTGLGHGDALHLTKFAPNMKGLQVWACHENKRDGSTFRDAATGNIIWQKKSDKDVGRCMAADIDPNNYGVEMWSLASGGVRNIKGELVVRRVPGLSTNMAVWWDGDLLRELLNGNRISKYNWNTKECEVIRTFDGCLSNNSTKSVPCLQGDMIGDWREEVLLRTEDNTALHLYVSPIPTRYRFHTFLEDPVYRISIATENVGYNQPTQPGFYFGPDLKGQFRGYDLE